MMCLGSVKLGDRIEGELVCRRCRQPIPAFSPTYNLVPAHSTFALTEQEVEDLSEAISDRFDILQEKRHEREHYTNEDRKNMQATQARLVAIQRRFLGTSA